MLLQINTKVVKIQVFIQVILTSVLGRSASKCIAYTVAANYYVSVK